MDRDKAIRAAKLTLGGMLEKNRHTTAVSRADGQIAPSKYLPNVPRAVHADGGKVAESHPFMQHLQQASDDMGHGFGFEEGGCLGMAHALAEEIGGRIAASKSGFKHYYAEKNGNLYDYTGKTQDKAGHTITSLTDAMRELGSSQNDHDADRASAKEVIEEAKSRAQGRATGGRAVHADGGAATAPMFQGIHPSLQNESGAPIDLYHGTTQDKEFEAFDNAKLGARDSGFYGRGHYLTADKAGAEEYANSDDTDGTVMGPLHTALKNPYIWDVSSDMKAHGTLRDLQSMGIMKEKSKLEAWDNLQRHHIAPFMAEMQKRGHDGVIVNTGNEDMPNGISEVVAFNPNTIKHKDAEVFDPNDPRIRRDDGGRVGYGNGGKSLGLYSKAAQVIRNQPQAKGSVDQLLAMVSKTKGVKPAELSNAGRPAGDTMSKEELAKHFEDALPKVDVERIGGRDSNGFPQYEDYTLPGGENYREHLLHLSDEREPPKALHRVMGAFPRDFDSEDGARQYIRQLDTLRNTPGMEGIAESLTRYPAVYQRENGQSADPTDFKSSHWNTPNVLAHVRMSDRDNGKTLHVHEVQSDWGQEGRENGFHDPKNPFEVINKKTKEVVSRHPDYSSMWDAYRTHPDSNNLTYGDVRDEKPPQAPYVGNTQQWTDLALKHIMTEAAKGGYERVVFSPGEASADMYGQRKKVSKLEFLKSNDSGEAGILSGFTPNGYLSSQHDVESHADLPKLIGKENAANLLAQSPTPSPDKGEDRYTHTLQGPLQVGGHGMVDYYKNYAHAGAFKLLQQQDPSIKPESYDLPQDYKGFGLPMTDTARQSILKNGFQAFQRGGEVHKATGGPVMGYVPMATLPTRRLINAPIQQQQPQASAGTFSKSLASLIDTVEGFKGEPEDSVAAPVAPSAASEGHAPTREGMSGAAEAAYAKLLDAYGQPLTINSSYRDPKKNAEVGGADGSQHMHGNAYDVDVTGKTYEERVALANQAYDSGFRGIGFYDNSMHFDVGDPRSWGPSYSRDSIPDWAQGFVEQRYGYAEGGNVMGDDNSNNVTDLSTVRTKREITSGNHTYGAQNMFSDLADKYTESKKAFDAAYSSGAFDNFDMGDMFKYKGPLNYSPDKIVGFTVKHISSWPQATKTYNDHYPAIEWETQNADRKVNNVPVEWLEDNLHKYEKVGGKPKIVKSGGGEVDDDIPNIKNPMSVFPKPQRMFPEDQRPAGGQYLSAHNKADVTGHKAESASIGIGPNGKPFFQASQNAVDQTGTAGRGSATVKTNLFKKKAGWKWEDTPDGHENTDTIVSVEHRGKHFYALNAHFPRGVDLARYENSPSEPRLRPTTQGNVTLGPQAGSINVRGKMHPVYHHVIVKADGGAVDNALALTRGFTKDGKSAITALKPKGK